MKKNSRKRPGTGTSTTVPIRWRESEQLSQAVHRSEFSHSHCQHAGDYPAGSVFAVRGCHVHRPCAEPTVSRQGFFRTIVLTPLGIPTIVSATIMTYIFDTSGYLNEALYRLGLLGEVPIDWAQGGWLSIGMVVFADTWKVLPLMVLLFIAGLEAIPQSVHEASQIDGSPPYTSFSRSRCR